MKTNYLEYNVKLCFNNRNFSFFGEKMKENWQRILTDSEALEEALKFGKNDFSLNPENHKIRIDPKNILCPICGEKELKIPPVSILIKANSSNTTHRAECNKCESVITLWNIALANHYYLG